MKPLKFNKRLRLNKKTIVNLNTGKMKNAYGGGGLPPLTEPEYTCEPWQTCQQTDCIICRTEGNSEPPNLCCKG
jgi:hypothetical protein